MQPNSDASFFKFLIVIIATVNNQRHNDSHPVNIDFNPQTIGIQRPVCILLPLTLRMSVAIFVVIIPAGVIATKITTGS